MINMTYFRRSVVGGPDIETTETEIRDELMKCGCSAFDAGTVMNDQIKTYTGGLKIPIHNYVYWCEQ